MKSGPRAGRRGTMRRTNQVCAVLLLLASVAAAADRQILPAPRRPLGAASHWRVRPDVVTLKVREPRLALQPISPRELMTALGQPASGGGFAVAGTAGLAETTTMKIQRRLEGVWTLRVPLAESGAFSSDAVDVQAEVVGITGSAGRLAPSASGEPEIAVRAVAAAAAPGLPAGRRRHLRGGGAAGAGSLADPHLRHVQRHTDPDRQPLLTAGVGRPPRYTRPGRNEGIDPCTTRREHCVPSWHV